MKFDYRDIEYFAAIARHGHIGRAAEALDLGQPALSLSLRRLERAANAKLVERTPKGVVLTAIGAALLRNVDRLRLMREDLERELADLAGGDAGSLRIGSSPSNALNVLPEVCRAMLMRSPKLSLAVSVHDNEALIPLLRKGSLDVTLGHRQPSSESDLTEIVLGKDEFVVYGAADHRLAKRKNLRLADLANERWAATEANAQGAWLSLRQLFGERGLPPPRIALTAPWPAIILRAIAHSDMLGISNKRHVRDVAASLHLAVLSVRDLDWSREAVLLHRRDGYLPPVATRFIQAMVRAHGAAAAD